MGRKLKKVFSISLLSLGFLVLCLGVLLFSTFKIIKNEQRDFSWAILLLKPIINFSLPQSLDFDRILLKYSTNTKKLEVDLGNVVVEDLERKIDVVFDDLALEIDPLFVFTGQKAIHKLSSDKFEVKISLADEDPQSLDGQMISRTSVLNALDEFYINSKFIYGKSISFKNGKLLYKREDSSEFLVGINSIESSVQPESYVILMSFDCQSKLSTLALTFKQSQGQYRISSSIQGVNLTNIKSIFPKSKYMEAIIADGEDTSLNANIILDYNKDAKLKELDVNLSIGTSIIKGSHQLKSLDFAANIKENVEVLDISKFNLVFGNNARIDTSLIASFNEGGVFGIYSDLPSKVDIKQSYFDLQVEQLTYFIPDNKGVEFKEWMDDSLNIGSITEGYNNIKLDQDFFVNNILAPGSIDCQLILKNAKLDYYDEHPDLIIGLATIKVFNDYFQVLSSDITTGNGLFVKDVQAKVPFNMDNIEINGKGTGDVKSLVDFINKEDHQIIKREGLEFSNLDSKLAIGFSVLVRHTPVEMISDIKFDINIASLETGKYIIEESAFEVSKINININADQKLVIQGGLEYEKIPLTFVFDNSYNDTDGKLKLKFAISKEVLRANSFGRNLDLIKGDLVFTASSLKTGGYELACDATNNEITFPKFEITKKENIKMLLSGKLDGLNMAKFTLSNVTAQGDNINFKFDLIKNKNLLDVKLRDGQFENNLFNAEFLRHGDHKKLYVDATYLDLRESLEDFISIEGEEDKVVKHFDYDVRIKKAKLKGNIIYNDLIVRLSCGDSLCDQIEMSANISGGHSVKVEQPDPEHKEKFVIVSDNAGILFKSLGIYTELENGKLRIDLTQTKNIQEGTDKNTIDISGQAKIYDFATKNNSLLTRLVLGLTTLDGIGSIIGNKNLHFSEMSVGISYSDGVIELKNGKLLSSGLDITLDGDIDLKKKYVILSGNLIPSVYGVNKMVNSIPLFGNLISGGGGVIDAKYRIYGDFGDIKTSVNPLSILPLGFFKNLFK